MGIREYPLNKFSDEPEASRRDAQSSFGEYGTVIRTLHRTFEINQSSNIFPKTSGRLYHPVDSPEEAQEWLEYYRKTDRYSSVYFVPTVVH